MKKLFVLIVVIFMAFSLTACKEAFDNAFGAVPQENDTQGELILLSDNGEKLDEFIITGQVYQKENGVIYFYTYTIPENKKVYNEWNGKYFYKVNKEKD